VHAMGRINFGPEMHDRKGLIGPIQFLNSNGGVITSKGWTVFNLSYDDAMLANLKFGKAPSKSSAPGIWQGEFTVEKVGDVYLDVRKWGKGVVWVNGYCLGRYWNIGPTQTMYIPGPWLKKGANKVLVLDIVGPETPVLQGLAEPILNELNPAKDFTLSKRPDVKFAVSTLKPNQEGQFAAGNAMQTITLSTPGKGRYFCIAAISSFDNKSSASIAELDLLDKNGNPISHQNWTIAYVSSEELAKENGSAENAIDGQTFNYWSSDYSLKKAAYPHYLVIDLGKEEDVSAFRYVPTSDANGAARIKDYQVFIGNDIVKKAY
jgi:beta-galactosidase